MKKIIVIVIIAFIGWYGNFYFKNTQKEDAWKKVSTSLKHTANNIKPFFENLLNDGKNLIGYSNEKKSSRRASRNKRFKCDGRQYCSQMTSCEEALFFLNNCPNTKMDGDRDGIPCEKQWCK